MHSCARASAPPERGSGAWCLELPAGCTQAGMEAACTRGASCVQVVRAGGRRSTRQPTRAAVPADGQKLTESRGLPFYEDTSMCVFTCEHQLQTCRSPARRGLT
eukprot:COSAG02_NODE_1250_length_13626_cov_72.701929_15_plen_104_part_00